MVNPGIFFRIPLHRSSGVITAQSAACFKGFFIGEPGISGSMILIYGIDVIIFVNSVPDAFCIPIS